jgi:23S rRNA (cytidine1920-2'-O)/16S rRNA (cytidine1409-2'-O)-methyltransferase
LLPYFNLFIGNIKKWERWKYFYMNKIRLDLLITEKKIVKNRERAKAMIMAGKVIVNGIRIDKAGTFVKPDSEITLKGNDIPYVSRGGLKLEKALKDFNIKVSGLVCFDIGASTGGFTDCLLQNGAKHVFAVDVGYGQFDWKLRNDDRITLIERTNIRFMEDEAIESKVDIVVIDVSFISLKIVVPAALKFLKNNGKIIALIKPQFEAGKGNVGKGGIIKSDKIHHKVIENLKEFFTKEHNLKIKSDIIPSPIFGAKGNKEFLIYMEK